MIYYTKVEEQFKKEVTTTRGFSFNHHQVEEQFKKEVTTTFNFSNNLFYMVEEQFKKEVTTTDDGFNIVDAVVRK